MHDTPPETACEAEKPKTFCVSGVSSWTDESLRHTSLPHAPSPSHNAHVCSAPADDPGPALGFQLEYPSEAACSGLPSASFQTQCAPAPSFTARAGRGTAGQATRSHGRELSD